MLGIEKLKNYQSLEPKYNVRQETTFPIFEFDLNGVVDVKQVLSLIENTPINYDRTELGLNILVNKGKNPDSGGYESSYFLHKDSRDWDFLINEILNKTILAEQKLSQTTNDEFRVSPKILNLWYLIYNKGSGQKKHEHGWLTKWVALYYVQVSETDAQLFITDLASENNELKIKPKPGTLLLFPSRCEHWVELQQGSSKRIVVAANIGFN